MPDVKYIYLFFKVDKCSGVRQGPYVRLTDGLPDVAVGELVAGWSISFEGLRFDVVATEVVG